MKNDFLKVVGIIVAIFVGVFIVTKMVTEAIIDGNKITAQTQLTALKMEHDHRERMADKWIEYHRQAFAGSRSILYQNLNPARKAGFFVPIISLI